LYPLRTRNSLHSYPRAALRSGLLNYRVDQGPLIVAAFWGVRIGTPRKPLAVPFFLLALSLRCGTERALHRSKNTTPSIGYEMIHPCHSAWNLLTAESRESLVAQGGNRVNAKGPQRRGHYRRKSDREERHRYATKVPVSVGVTSQDRRGAYYDERLDVANPPKMLPALGGRGLSLTPPFIGPSLSLRLGIGAGHRPRDCVARLVRALSTAVLALWRLLLRLHGGIHMNQRKDICRFALQRDLAGGR